MVSASLLLVVGLTVQGAVPAQAPSAEALAGAYYQFMRGRSLEARGEVAEAVLAFRRAIELLPEAAEARAELAGLFARAGRAFEAVTEAEAALAVDATNREAHRILGFVKAAQAERASGATASGLVRQAIGHFEQMLAAGPPDPGVQLTLGQLYVTSRDYAQAITTLKEFLLGQPGYTEGLLLLAQAYEATGDLSNAVATLEEALSTAPPQPNTQLWLAELYERAGRWTDAAGLWAALAQTGQQTTQFRLRQATALVNGGQLETGRSLLDQLSLESAADTSVWYLLSQVELRAGDPAAAEAAARRILAIDADDPRGPLALADVLALRGDHPAVVAVLTPRVTSPPPADLQSGVHARLASALASSLQESGDRAGAVAVLEAAQQRVPGDDELLYLLAAAYERDDQFDAAERTFRDVLARAPGHAGALNYLGYMLADRGLKLDESVQLIQRALDVEPANPSFLDSLGWAYFKLERYVDAREPLERAAKAMAEVSVVQDHLGDLYFQLKMYRDAAAAFERALTGDQAGIDVAGVTKKRDRARELARR